MPAVQEPDIDRRAAQTRRLEVRVHELTKAGNVVRALEVTREAVSQWRMQTALTLRGRYRGGYRTPDRRTT
jgi:hypothetical protein